MGLSEIPSQQDRAGNSSDAPGPPSNTVAAGAPCRLGGGDRRQPVRLHLGRGDEIEVATPGTCELDLKGHTAQSAPGFINRGRILVPSIWTGRSRSCVLQGLARLRSEQHHLPSTTVKTQDPVVKGGTPDPDPCVQDDQLGATATAAWALSATAARELWSSDPPPPRSAHSRSFARFPRRRWPEDEGTAGESPVARYVTFKEMANRLGSEAALLIPARGLEIALWSSPTASDYSSGPSSFPE
jgi:hypothetical protein